VAAGVGRRFGVAAPGRRRRDVGAVQTVAHLNSTVPVDTDVYQDKRQRWSMAACDGRTLPI